MAQTNTVSVFVQMSAVTAIGVADRPEDCSKSLLQRLRSTFCRAGDKAQEKCQRFLPAMYMSTTDIWHGMTYC